MPVSEATVSRRARTGASSSVKRWIRNVPSATSVGTCCAIVALSSSSPPSIRVGLVQGPEKIAGIVAGDAQAPLPGVGRERQGDAAALRQPAVQLALPASPGASRTRWASTSLRSCPPSRTRSAASMSDKGVGGPPSSSASSACARACEERVEVERLGPDADLVASLRLMTQVERTLAAAGVQPAQNEALDLHRLGRDLETAGGLEPGGRELEGLDLDRAVLGDQQRRR